MMQAIKNYSAIAEDEKSKRFETFSYLPQMTGEALNEQISYLLNQGLQPIIEHVEPKRSLEYYWYMWKLPMFGETEVDAVLSEINNCHSAYPNHHIRLSGYDNKRQSQGSAFVVHRAYLDNQPE